MAIFAQADPTISPHAKPIIAYFAFDQIISQTTELQGGVAGKIDLILEGNIKYSEITSREYVEAGDAGNGIEGEGVRVGSQVPIDMFNFGSATIEVTGSALLNLKADADGDENGGTSRKLVAEIGTSANNDEEASYELEVTLKQQVESEEDLISSAKSATNKGVAGIISLFALASVIWQIYIDEVKGFGVRRMLGDLLV